MKLQNQTKLHDPVNGIRGNCMMTTYASYLDLDISQVPNIEDLFDCQPHGFWYSALSMWLKDYHYKMDVHHKNDPYLSGYTDYYFAIGPSSRGVMHQVIYKDGKLFHDPHPSAEGLIEVQGYITLQDIS